MRCDGELFRAVHVARVNALAHGPERDRAVHGAGIDIGEAESLGEPLGDGAFARAGGSVDRDYDTFVICISQKSE